MAAGLTSTRIAVAGPAPPRIALPSGLATADRPPSPDACDVSPSTTQSSPRPATPGDIDKAVAYYSDKPGRALDVDLNCEVEFADNAEQTIACRHLALAWTLLADATGKPDYDVLGNADALQAAMPSYAMAEAAYIAATRRSPQVHLVPLDRWGEFAAGQFRALEATGESARRLLVESCTHSMAVEFKIKHAAEGLRYVQNLYDPNLTATHKRAAAADLRRMETLGIADLLELPDTARTYFGNESVVAAIALPPGGLATLPPGGATGRRLAGPMPALTPAVINHLVIFDLDGSLRDIAADLHRLATRDPKQAAQVLAARDDDGAPVLSVAMQKGVTNAVRAYCELVNALPLRRSQRAALFTAPNLAGTPALSLAMQDGHAEVITAFVEGVAASRLRPSRQVELLVALRANGDIGLSLAGILGQEHAIPAFMAALSANAALRPRHRFKVLATRNSEGEPALFSVAGRGEPACVKRLVEGIVGAGFDPARLRKLLLGRDSDGTYALEEALHNDNAANVRAYAEAVLAAPIEVSLKVEVLGCEDRIGPLIARAADLQALEAIVAYREAVRASDLPEPLRARLLAGANQRRRLA